jgi:uncharacterized integral membrane protein
MLQARRRIMEAYRGSKGTAAWSADLGDFSIVFRCLTELRTLLIIALLLKSISFHAYLRDR